MTKRTESASPQPYKNMGKGTIGEKKGKVVMVQKGVGLTRSRNLLRFRPHEQTEAGENIRSFIFFLDLLMYFPM